MRTTEKDGHVTGSVLVVGGTGRVGRVVARLATTAGYDAATASRHGQVVLDHDDLSTLPTALKGVDRLFVAIPDRPDMAEIEGRLYTHAVAAGVRRIVKLSAASAGWEPPSSFGKAHRQGEEMLQGLPVEWTILRPVVFQQTIDLFCGDLAKGRMVVPSRSGAVAFVDAEDVAAVGAAALTRDDLVGKTLNLTGPRAWTFSEIAAQLSVNCGRRVRHIYVPRPIARRLLPVVTDMPRWLVDQIVDLLKGLDQGLQREVTTDVNDVLQRDPQPVEPNLDAIRAHRLG